MRAWIVQAPAFVADRTGDLRGQFLKKAIDHVADVVGQGKSVDFLLSEIAGEKNILELFQDLDHGFLGGNHDGVVVGDGAFLDAALHDLCDHLRDFGCGISR